MPANQDRLHDSQGSKPHLFRGVVVDERNSVLHDFAAAIFLIFELHQFFSVAQAI
jgi:hypothetical protein